MVVLPGTDRGIQGVRWLCAVYVDQYVVTLIWHGPRIVLTPRMGAMRKGTAFGRLFLGEASLALSLGS